MSSQVTDSGQSTLEAALILALIATLCILLASLWRKGEDGSLVQYAHDAASHTLGGIYALQDIVSF